MSARLDVSKPVDREPGTGVVIGGTGPRVVDLREVDQRACEHPVRVTHALWSPRETALVREALAEGGSDADWSPGRVLLGWAEGPVAIAPRLACGACERCRSGLAAHCRDGVELGQPAGGRARGPAGELAGGLAGVVDVPAFARVPLPTDLDPLATIHAWRVALACQARRVAALEGKSFVSVLGDGPHAILCAQVMLQANTTVRVLTEDAWTLGRCERLGLRHRPTREVGLREDQDAVIDTEARREHLELAWGLTRPRGRVLIVPDGASVGMEPIDMRHAIENELTVQTVRDGSLREGVSAIAEGRVNTDGLCEGPVRVEGFAAGLVAGRFPERDTLIEMAGT